MMPSKSSGHDNPARDAGVMAGHKPFFNLLTPEQRKIVAARRAEAQRLAKDACKRAGVKIDPDIKALKEKNVESMLETNPEAYAPLPGGRGFVLKEDKFKWSIKGEPGEFLSIHKKLLNVDRCYQRDLNENRAIAIASAFNWVRFGVLSVARREDDSLWVFDGQTRLHAVKKLQSIQSVPCVVFDLGNSVQSEAMAFIEINMGSKAVSGVDKYRAMLVTHDPTALLLDELFKTTGYTVSSKPTGSSVKCVHTLLRIAKKPDEIRQLWGLLVQIHDGTSIHQRIVEGVHYLAVATEGRIYDDRYWDRLVNAGREGVLSAIQKAAAYHRTGGPKVYAQGIVEHIINKGLREQNKIFLN